MAGKTARTAQLPDRIEQGVLAPEAGADFVGEEVGYGGPQVCKIVGITYRQLDYWARTDLLRPSLVDAAGSGSQRRYSYRDLVALKVIKSLLDAGLSLQTARKAIEYLRDHLGEDLASASLVLDGTRSVLVRTGEDIVDVVRQGQGVLNIVPLAGLVEQLDASIHELRAGCSHRGAGAASRPGRERRWGRVTITPADTLPHEQVRFAHNSERQFAKLLDFYGIAWEYEPRTFTLELDAEGNPAQGFTPDFYLPAQDVYIEITTLNQRLVTKKNRKARRLVEQYPEVRIKVLYQRDYLHLLVKYGLEPPSQLVDQLGTPETVAARRRSGAARASRRHPRPSPRKRAVTSRPCDRACSQDEVRSTPSTGPSTRA